MIYREIRAGDMAAIFDVRVKTGHNPNGAQEMAKMGDYPWVGEFSDREFSPGVVG